MSKLNTIEQLRKKDETIKKPEHMMGRSLKQPFANMNSASRKLMHASQEDQVLTLFNPEPPLVGTGYANEFGRYNSSFIEADVDYEVIAKIPKFKSMPEHHYIVVVREKDTNRFHVFERKIYTYNTESYGYINDTTFLDSLHLGSSIHKGDVISKSNLYDYYNNRQEGRNVLTGYMAIDHTNEDAMVISESLRDKFVSPLIHPIEIVINDNDIPLNVYGDHTNYKVIPEIGEEIVGSLVCALRREKKEEALFAQSVNRLQNILISDEKFTADGQLIDINIYCNNPEGLVNSFYSSQINRYYKDSLEYSSRIVEALKPIVRDTTSECSYDLKNLFFYHKRVLEGKSFFKDKPFSNIILELVFLNKAIPEVGDKFTDRYGGKGVISAIWPDEMMPKLDNGKHLEIIQNPLGVPNRQNVGQLIEIFLNNKAARIIEYLDENLHELEDWINSYLQFLDVVCPQQADYMRMKFQYMSDDAKLLFVSEFAHFGIRTEIEPISESLDIDALSKIMEAFPWIEAYAVFVPQVDSNGNIRYIPARRRLYCGKKFIYRLKQYSEDKFSATSLSATNIRNEPTKSKASKDYKSPYSKTPIRSKGRLVA